MSEITSKDTGHSASTMNFKQHITFYGEHNHSCVTMLSRLNHLVSFLFSL